MNRTLMDSLPSAPQLSLEGGIGMQSATLDQLAVAKAKADSEIRNIRKTSSNSYFKSEYADLDEITKFVRPVYAGHGLSISQAPWFIDGHDMLVTTLMHESGQWLRSVMRIAASPDKSGFVSPQAMGSALTYARRYSLSGIVNITGTDEDDDGEAAMNRSSKPESSLITVNNIEDTLDASNSLGAEIDLSIALKEVNTKSEFEEWRRTNGQEIATLQNNDPQAFGRLKVEVDALREQKGWAKNG